MKGTSLTQTVGYLQLFRQNRNFRYLFFARISSLLGDWFNVLAVLALLRSMGHHSATSFGLVLILKTLPSLLMAPIAGVFADRMSRRLLMILSDIARFFILLAMLSLTFFPKVWLLYVLIVLQAMAATFFEPARNALLPEIVNDEELTAANTVGAASWSLMLTVGSLLGGLFTAFLGWQAAIAVDALTYLVSMMLLFRLQEPPMPARPKSNTSTSLIDLLGLRDLYEGWSYIFRRPRILSLVLVKTGWCLAGSINLVLTLLGERVFAVAGLPMLGVTVLYVARGIGTGLGPFVSRHLSQSREDAMERFIAVGFLCGAVFYMLIPLSPNLWIVCPLLVCAHLGGATIWVFSTIRLQQLVPNEVRGRVFATEQAGFTVAMAISTAVYSVFVDKEVASLRWITAFIGFGMIVPTVLWLLRGWRLGWAGEKAQQEAILKTV